MRWDAMKEFKKYGFHKKIDKRYQNAIQLQCTEKQII